MKRPHAHVGLALSSPFLIVLFGCAVGPAVPPVPAAAVTPTALPPPTPVPTVVAPISPPLPEREDVQPPLVRVLLKAPAEPLFPEPGRRYACVAGPASSVMRGPLLAKLVPGRPGVQVGAFAQEENAKRALARLNAAGFQVRIDARVGGATHVIALANAGEDQDAFHARLTRAGFADQSPVGLVEDGGVILQGEDGAHAVAPTFRIVPLDPDPVRVGGKSVRGEFELLPQGQGVAVVNVVNIEQYLRGVVPAEMGPRSFGNVEALKAQAVAARTYAVSHLGDHAVEGYDLCDSQACQVYEGASAEHPLSDRAVLETAGEVAMWQGRPIDAMYHSTCAGHTEDAGALFPDRAEPYLKGVPCTGDSTVTVGSTGPVGAWLGPLERLTTVGEALAIGLGCPHTARGLTTRLTGTVPGQGSAALVRAFGLEEGITALHIGAASGDGAAIELLRTFRLPLPPPPHGTGRGPWEMAFVVRLAQLAGKVQVITGRLVPSPTGARLVPDGPESAQDLAGSVHVLVKSGERWRRAPVSALAGSPATLWCAGEVCPAVEVEPMDAADAASLWTWWVRELTLGEIGRRLGLTGVRDIRVLRRGVSGRALAVAMVTADGSREIAGIPFRRALDLPDTLFYPLKVGSRSNTLVRFLGRGWGHGVGMCQNGAYGLARGGKTYVEILKTYYTGVEITRWEGGRP